MEKKQTSKKKNTSATSIKRQAGRPSKYNGIDLKQVEKLAKQGFTDVQLADFFEVCEATWNNWKRDHPGFLESLNYWKAIADEKVEKALYKRAIGYSHIDTKFATHEGYITDSQEYTKHYPPCPTSCIYWLNNRKKKEWKARVDVESGGQPLQGPTIVAMDDETGKLIAKAVERKKKQEG